MNLNNLHNEAKKIRMTPAEKAIMRSQLFGAPSYTSTASPYFAFNFQFMTRAFAGVLLVLVVLGGGGTAFAAEGSIPGDLLYGVKVNVTEPIQTALAVGAEARADVHLELAQRRVEEAETLAAAGKLDATTTQELEDNFNSHAQAADELALEVGHEDPSAAVEIQTKLSSSLSVHGAILAALGDDSTNANTKTNSNALAARVLARADEHASGSSRSTFAVAAKKTAPVAAQNQNNNDVSGAPTATTFAVTAIDTNTATGAADATSSVQTNAAPTTSAAAPTTTSAKQNKQNTQMQNAAAQNQKRAADALAQARTTYQDVRSSLSANVRASVDSQLGSADKRMTEGVQFLAKGNIQSANKDFTAVYTLAVKLQAVLAAQKKFKKDLTPLLNVQIDSHTEANDTSTTTVEPVTHSGEHTDTEGAEGSGEDTQQQDDQNSNSGPQDRGGIIQKILKAF